MHQFKVKYKQYEYVGPNKYEAMNQVVAMAGDRLSYRTVPDRKAIEGRYAVLELVSGSSHDNKIKAEQFKDKERLFHDANKKGIDVPEFAPSPNAISWLPDAAVIGHNDIFKLYEKALKPVSRQEYVNGEVLLIDENLFNVERIEIEEPVVELPKEEDKKDTVRKKVHNA